jgi:hypothetical protein
MSSGTAPTAAGGDVVDGTYEMTSSVFYGTLPDASASGDFDYETRRETFVVKNATSSSFTLDQFRVDGTENSSEEGTVAVSSSTATVTYTPTCPPPGDGGNNGGSAGYTSDGSTFTLIISKAAGKLVRVYTKTS